MIFAKLKTIPCYSGEDGFEGLPVHALKRIPLLGGDSGKSKRGFLNNILVENDSEARLEV